MNGIIICSRVDSSRIYKKPLQRLGFENKTLIEHLIDSLTPLDIPIILAIPKSDITEYQGIIDRYHNKISLYYGHDRDPLARMYHAARVYKIDTVIRITHDKLFMDNPLIEYALRQYNAKKCDYLFSSHFVDGAGFEIIDFEILKKAAKTYRNVEHISYAIRLLTKKIYNLNLIGSEFSYHPSCEHHFLIDFPADVFLMNELFSKLGSHITLKQAIDYLDTNKEMARINYPPLVTFYTCVKNGAEHLDECIKSVVKQKIFKKSEYLIINDFSSDDTFKICSKYKLKYSNIKIIHNHKNKGLSSSSNIALKNSRGRYIIRIDHDDYLTDTQGVSAMVKDIRDRGLDCLYPDNYFGDMKKIQKGNECHHVGGALFLKKSINFIKFTDGLRGYEGKDLFIRAKNVLSIGYFNSPTFFYRQRNNSMSHTVSKERTKIEKEIDEKKGAIDGQETSSN